MGRLEAVVRGKLVDALFGIDELRGRWRIVSDYAKATSHKKSGMPFARAKAEGLHLDSVFY